jgi:ribosomal protein L11 methyltransferase
MTGAAPAMNGGGPFTPLHVVMNPSSPSGPGWTEITLEADPAAHEAVSDFLLNMPGCAGVAGDPDDGRVLRAYLPAGVCTVEEIRSRIEGFLSRLPLFFPEAGPFSFRLGSVKDNDWSTAWRKHFRTEQVTPGLLIVPAWEPVPLDHRARYLLMDPGPAFGTGAHPSTRMCLRAMEELAPTEPFSLLDAGTGSGILAMYGALLGARPVLGVDIDREALRWARWNLELNGLAEKVRLSPDPLEGLDRSFTMVAANLVLDVILDLMPCFPGLVAPGGTLILSGLLENQGARVKPLLETNGFGVGAEFRAGEWICISAGRDRP